ALEAGRAAPAPPLVLIAPALGFGSRWLEKLPPGDSLQFFHHGEGKDLVIHRRFFEVMAGTEADRDPPGMPVTILMGRRDESVPFDVVRGVWTRWQDSGRLAEGSRFVEIPDGDHGLTASVNQIAEEILLAAALPR